jgi:hypothetical protein
MLESRTANGVIILLSQLAKRSIDEQLNLP